MSAESPFCRSSVVNLATRSRRSALFLVAVSRIRSSSRILSLSSAWRSLNSLACFSTADFWSRSSTSPCAGPRTSSSAVLAVVCRDAHLAAGRGDLVLGPLVLVLEQLDPVVQLGLEGGEVALAASRSFLAASTPAWASPELFLEVTDLLLLLFRGRFPVLRGHEDHGGDAQEDQGEGHDDDDEDLANVGHGPILPIRSKTAGRPPSRRRRRESKKGWGLDRVCSGNEAG